MPTQLPAETLLYLWTCPGTADFGYISPQEFGEKVGTTKTLPENIRRALVSEGSAERVQKLVLWKHRLPLGEAQTVARILGTILRGEDSPANLRLLLEQGVQVAPKILDDLSQDLTEAFITPNYFQIAQVYEKRHKRAGDRALGTAVPSGPSPAPRPIPPARTPPRVVDLRNGAIPPRLPPSPAPAPRPVPRSPEGEVGSPAGAVGSPGGEVGPAPKPLPPSPPPPPPPPPPTAPVPPSPPPPPRNGGPSADDLLQKLGRPGGGTHGPLPPPA